MKRRNYLMENVQNMIFNKFYNTYKYIYIYFVIFTVSVEMFIMFLIVNKSFR